MSWRYNASSDGRIKKCPQRIKLYIPLKDIKLALFGRHVNHRNKIQIVKINDENIETKNIKKRKYKRCKSHN